MPTLDLPLVDTGKIFGYDGLHARAVEALEASGRTRSDVANALGVSPPAITRALREVGGRYAALQIRIIELLHPELRVDKDDPPIVFMMLPKDAPPTGDPEGGYGGED